MKKYKRAGTKANKLISAIIYFFAIFLCLPFFLLPVRFIYIFSDILTPFLYYVLRYRRKVVRENLRHSFPDKTQEEIKNIEKQFYKHLGDVFAEYLLLLKINKKNLDKRLEYKNPELLDELHKKGKDVILIMGHYANWELFAHIATTTKYVFSPVYKEQSNKYFDHLIYKLRSKFGAQPIDMEHAFRYTYDNKQNNTSTLLLLISDQSPKQTRFFVDFLNHKETPVFEGAERIGKALDMAIVFGDVKKTSRGHYSMEYALLCENPKETKQGEITELHVRYLEKKIQENPHHWLWSHRRWKRTKKDIIEN
jgi:KDO2-lipid IV(A) lauroyltransferase